MDGETLLDDLQDDYETELSRLGSSKALYALTDGNMEGPEVLTAVAAESAAAREVFGEWADEATHEPAGDLYEDVAVDARDHLLDTGAQDDVLPDTTGPMYETLSGLDSDPERLGGLLARSLVAGNIAEQTVGFFVGEADPSSADTFRQVRDDIHDHRERAAHVLNEVCASDGDWDEAQGAAAATIEAAYDFYVDTLESMGVNPKNVC